MTYGPGGLDGTEGQGHSEVIDIRKRPEGTGREPLEGPGVSDNPEGSEGQRVERSRRLGRFGR